MNTVKYTSLSDDVIQSLGSTIPAQLEQETERAYKKLKEVLNGNVVEFVANRL